MNFYADGDLYALVSNILYAQGSHRVSNTRTSRKEIFWPFSCSMVRRILGCQLLRWFRNYHSLFCQWGQMTKVLSPYRYQNCAMDLFLTILHIEIGKWTSHSYLVHMFVKTLIPLKVCVGEHMLEKGCHGYRKKRFRNSCITSETGTIVDKDTLKVTKRSVGCKVMSFRFSIKWDAFLIRVFEFPICDWKRVVRYFANSYYRTNKWAHSFYVFRIIYTDEVVNFYLLRPRWHVFFFQRCRCSVVLLVELSSRPLF